jgi:hypothetical protein
MQLWGPAIAIFLFSLPGIAQQDQAAPAAAPAPSASTTTSGAASPADHPQLDLTPDANGALSQSQIQALIRVVAQNHRDNYKKQHDYTYIDREVEQKLDGSGQVKATEIKTYEVMQLYDAPITRLIEKDDKPLNQKDAAKEEERIQKIADKRKNETEEERRKKDAEKEKAREKGREFVSEVADAYNFRLVGSEMLNGRDNWVIEGEPRPDYHAHLKEAEMLAKIRGRLWIDKAELQLAKMDIEAIGTLSFGWVLARFHKGTRFVYEETRVNDEVWLPQHYEARVDLRLALFKSDNEQDEGTYRDYKKFRTSARIVSVGDVQPQK